MNYLRTISIALFALAFFGCSDGATLLAPATPDATASEVLSKGKSERRSAAPPYWSLLADGLFARTDDQAIIPFVREIWGGSQDQICGADAPNLLVLDPAAFTCPLAVSGFEHWQDGKWDDGLPWDGAAPRQVQLRGLGAVPIIIAEWNEFEAALADGLSGAELLNLASVRIGYADRFHSTNILGLSGPQGIGNGKYTITASGFMDDGQEFRLLVAGSPGIERQVHLDFE